MFFLKGIQRMFENKFETAKKMAGTLFNTYL